MKIGDVVTVSSFGNGKAFRVEKIDTDGRVSGPAVLINRFGANGVEVVDISPEVSGGLRFDGFETKALELVHGASRQ